MHHTLKGDDGCKCQTKVEDSCDGPRPMKQDTPIREPVLLLQSINVSALQKDPKPRSSLPTYYCWLLIALSVEMSDQDCFDPGTKEQRLIISAE